MAKQPRIDRGFDAQVAVKRSLPPELTIVSCARPGSNKPDLVSIVDGRLIQFEVKSCDNITSTIVPISCTVRQNTTTFIDGLVPLFTNHEHQSISSIIDHHRLSDPTIGFPCDDGTGRSGRIPPQLSMSSSHMNISRVHDAMIRYWHECKNHYLVVVCRKPTQTIHVFHTGYGDNRLNAPLVPRIRSARIGTYGSAPPNALRVALKITLPQTSGLILPQ